MKHPIKITIIILGMFLATQFLGLLIASHYSPQFIQTQDENGNIINQTDYNLPYGFSPPEETNPQYSFISIVMALTIAIILMFVLMKFELEKIIRAWFFVVVIVALGISINAGISSIYNFTFASFIAIIISIPLSYYKIYKRNILVHNLTELLIYPGVAVIFIPWFNILTISSLLILISIYDIWAVNHTGHMQKMANFQITKLKIFGGFLVPHLGKNQKDNITKLKKSKEGLETLKTKKFRINFAVLGGGDIAWPMILAGVVLHTLGLIPALLVIFGASMALFYLFYFGEKSRPYPAMPYITTGCFIILTIVYFLRIFW
jgi:presenilin-like A22 family membrane protease